MFFFIEQIGVFIFKNASFLFNSYYFEARNIVAVRF